MRATPQTSRSPRRFVDIPLLLLRCLVLLLVAFGFGRLLIPGMRSRGARAYAAIVVDVSGSMQARRARRSGTRRRSTSSPRWINLMGPHGWP